MDILNTTDQAWSDEPIIVINGTALTAAQAMTVRVAIQNLAFSLQRLGDDEVGKDIRAGYLAAMHVINRLMRL